MADKVTYLYREKVLFDTSVYISHLRYGHHAALMVQQIRSSILYLHSIVFEELLAGTASPREIKRLSSLKKTFFKANRIVTPTDRDWEETGLLVNRLIGKKGASSKRIIGMTHDILIALSARRLGIRVITENKKDFEMIRSARDFKLTVWAESNAPSLA